jgi:hypothetical protein
MTPVLAVVTTGAASALALAIIFVVSAIPVAPLPLLNPSSESGAGDHLAVGLADDGFGRECAINISITTDHNVTFDDISGFEPATSCIVLRQQWFQILGDVAAVAFGPFFALLVVILRWLADRRHRGTENPGRRRAPVELGLSVVGLVLFAVTVQDEITIAASNEGAGWVSYYGGTSWASHLQSYLSSIGLGLVLGAGFSFCSDRIEAALEATLNS